MNKKLKTWIIEVPVKEVTGTEKILTYGENEEDALKNYKNNVFEILDTDLTIEGYETPTIEDVTNTKYEVLPCELCKHNPSDDNFDNKYCTPCDDTNNNWEPKELPS